MEPTEKAMCALHELRLTELEKAISGLADTTKSLELVVARAAGALVVFAFAQPILSGLILNWLMSKGK